MTRTLLSLPVAKNFNFRSVLYSHGWSDLRPFAVGGSGNELQCVISLAAQRHVPVVITAKGSGLSAACEFTSPLSAADKKRIAATVRSMLRLDEPIEEFYSLCRNESRLRWIPKIGGGRMLRSATVFEDIVKMICTTNCSWSLTKIIVNHLAAKLGENIGNGVVSFPSPEAIASRSEKWLRKETSSGYRAPYLLEFAKRVASGSLSVEHLRTADMPTDELYAYLRTIKGVGHYAAGNLLKLLGHYDYLSVDSWIRMQFSTIHKKGRKVSDATIEKHYAHYGKWRGLVCWMEMTQEWHV